MRKFIRRVIMLILICIFAYSSYNLYVILNEYKKNKDSYSNISEIVVKEDKEIEIKDEEYTTLKNRNQDYLFWLNIPGTNINYPVVQSKDNEDYLYRNFDGEENKGGCLFVDCRNTSIDDKNLVIHGHNMKDKSMFGTLSNLLKSDYLNENKKIYIFLEGKKLEYEIFSVYVNELEFNPYVTTFNTDEEFNEYINSSMKKSFYDLEYPEQGENRIITLSTCTNATGIERTIVNAKLVSISEN